MVRKRRHGEGVNLSLHFSPSLHFPILSPFSHSPSISIPFSRLLSISSSFSHSLAIFSEAASQLPSTCAGLSQTTVQKTVLNNMIPEIRNVICVKKVFWGNTDSSLQTALKRFTRQGLTEVLGIYLQQIKISCTVDPCRVVS